MMELLEGEPEWEELRWADLRDQFRKAREETVRVARALQQGDIASDTNILHNQWHELTVNGWLCYLNFHANKDIKALERS